MENETVLVIRHVPSSPSHNELIVKKKKKIYSDRAITHAIQVIDAQ